jgi:hypothetical protein
MPSPRRLSAAVVLALVLGFLLLRAVLFALTTAGEYALYQSYAQDVRDGSLAGLYADREVEYPPLAVLFGVVALYVTDLLPEGVERLTAWRPNPPRSMAGSRYEVGLGLTLFAVDLAGLLLVYAVARRCYPDEGNERRAARLGVYVAATTALGLIVYDRQDLVVGLFPLLALLAFAQDRPVLAYGVLTAGGAYKLVPLLLLPLWVLGFAAARSAPATPRSFLAATVKQAVLAGLVLAAYPVLSYLLWGPRSFLFLSFHSDRGLQLEATAAWLVFVLDPDARVGYSHGSHSVLSPLADRLATVTTGLTALATLAVVVVTGRGFGTAATAPATPARARLIRYLALGSLWAWLAFVLFNKVGSPQYLLWLAPLLPLLPLRGGDRGFAVVLLLGMFFTSLVFPGQYPLVRGELIHGSESDPPGTRVWAGPGPPGLALITAKSVSLTVAFVWLSVIVARQRHSMAEAPRDGRE